MHIDFLRKVFSDASEKQAFIWQDTAVTYAWLLEEIDRCTDELRRHGLQSGSVVAVEADFSPRAIALLLSLIEHPCVVVPLTTSVEAKKPEFCDIAEVETIISIGRDDSTSFAATGRRAVHPLLTRLKQTAHPGLVLFSSGSTGKSKAALHDLIPMLEKFKVPRHSLRTITFLLFDHIGGFNTLFYSLSNAGCIVTVQDRSPEAICHAMEKYRVQLLPTSPTFINLLLLSRAYRGFDLSSLEMVTYGTEVMPESTLERFHSILPNVKLLQTYGLSEVGILRSKSKASDSLWVKIGGEGFETRVIDGMLEIKAQSAMLGYLNAPNPFTEDGWFKTGDAVDVRTEEDGDYFRILGRKSEIINVGGEKVYPAEVESILQTMDGVEDVAVSGESHPLTGQIVVAKIKLGTGESLSDFRRRMRAHFKNRPRFQIPQKVELVDDTLHSERFKKMRNQ